VGQNKPQHKEGAVCGSRWFGRLAAIILAGLVLPPPALAQSPRIEAQRGLYEQNLREWRTPPAHGQPVPVLYGRNARFTFFGDIALSVEDAVSLLKPNEAGQPVVLDDPASFSIEVLQGRITLPATALDALMNEHTLNFAGAPVRKVRIATTPGTLSLAGEMDRKGKWVPFTLAGPVSLEDGRYVLLEAKEIMVAGLPATALLGASNIQLDELLKLKTDGIELKGSTIRLDSLNLFPPPKLTFTIASVAVEEKGLVLDFRTGKPLTLPSAIAPAESFFLISGGRLKMMRTLLENATVQAVANTTGEALDFSLYDYREQLAAGRLEMHADGNIVVRLGKAGR
jgi:hypothetical protein